MSKAFKTMKKVHVESKFNCKHDIDSSIEFLLSKIDTSYRSKQVLENGKTINVSMMDKLKKFRKC